MILVSGLQLKAVLDLNVAATQPVVHVDYIDWNPHGQPTPPAPFRTALNNSTAVVILASTVANQVREPIEVSIYNGDTTSVSLSVLTDDGTTQRIICKHTLTSSQSLHWKKNYPWTKFAVS